MSQAAFLRYDAGMMTLRPFALPFLLAACSADIGPGLTLPPLDAPSGATRADYAPEVALATFPDDWQTVEDRSRPTGRRVQLTPGARAEFEALEDVGFTVLGPLESLDGGGLLAPVTLRFSAPVDGSTLEGAVRWWDLDDGVEVPWEAEIGPDGATLFLSPLRPLTPAHAHAVFVTRDIRDAQGGGVWPSDALWPLLWGVSSDRPDVAASWLRAVQASGLEPSDIAHGTVFTTQSAFDVEREAASVLAQQSPGITSLGGCVPDRGARRCEAAIEVVDLLGADDVLEAGAAISVQRTYTLPITAWLPDVATAGPGPWPTVVHSHGLGGGRWEAGGIAESLAGLPFVVVAVDAPRHNDHPTATTDADLFWVFQFFGIDETTFSFDVGVLRDAWRRAAWDKVQLVNALVAGADLDGDGVGDVQGDQLHATGHSLGAIMAVHLLADAPALRSGMLSVPGGRVGAIVQKSPTFAPLVALLAPDDVEPVDIDRFFALLQASIDSSEPAVHAARAVQGRDVWQDMVLGDDIIPNVCNRALARAIAPQIAGEILDPIPSLGPAIGFPVSSNVDGFTRVLTQAETLWNGTSWDRVGHSDVVDHPARVAQLRAWLTSARDGRATLPAAAAP
jgi:dienelactone hydrolase